MVTNEKNCFKIWGLFKMKILYITKFFPPEHGGIEILSKKICDFFNNQNNEIEVLCFSKKKTFISKKNGYKVNHFKSLFNFFSTPISLDIIFFLIKNFKKYDYVHIHTPNPWITFCIIFLPIRKIIVSWGSDIVNQKFIKFFFYPIQYLLLKKAEKIICLSKNYFNHSDELKPFSNKIFIIPPIQKINLTKLNLKKKNRIINIVTVGRLVDYKGHNIAINAIKYLPKNYMLTIIGAGPNKTKILSQISNLNLQDRIKLLDKTSDDLKINILKKATIFLMCSTSRAESFGIAILEAISCGLPLVISNINGSGMNDMIVNNFNGYKFKNFSSIDCAKKIVNICNNNNKLNHFSKNSLKLFSKRFAYKKIEKKLYRIYK